MLNIHDLLEVAMRQKASDLVIKAGAAPAIRIDGRMQITELPKITPEATRELAVQIIDSASRDTLLQYPNSEGRGVESEIADIRLCELEQKREIDLVFTIPGLARVRANLYLQRGTIGAALRII